MKRLITATVLALFITGSAFATDGTIPTEVIWSFKNSFSNATQVVYSEVNDMIRVEFMNGTEKRIAYYNPSGSLIVLTKPISPDQLPGALQQDLKNRFKGYTVTEVHKFENDGQVEYYIFLEGSKKDLVLNAPGSRWKTFRVTKK